MSGAVLLLPVAGCYNEGSFLLLLREFPLHACQYVGDFFAYALSVSAGSGACFWRISLWKVRRQGMASQSSASIVSR